MRAVEVKGHNGTIHFDGRMITIVRKGALARATIGKGEKQIPLQMLSAVQFKPAGPLVNGFIQFTLAGGNETRSQFGRQTTDAARDENSVIFHYAQRKPFEELHAQIQVAMAGETASPVGGQSAAPPPPATAAPAAGWLPDPNGRHQHRYFDGQAWTDHVADNGRESTDPFAE